MQVIGGDQFGLEWVVYNPKKPTIVIVHGFLSYSAADWVVNMTNAFLSWVNRQSSYIFKYPYTLYRLI